MAHDPARAALALLCVVIVAFAASLFPASGFGTYPATVGSGGSNLGSGASGPGSTPGDVGSEPVTPTPSAPNTDIASAGPNDAGSQTTTPTNSTTAPPPADGSSNPSRPAGTTNFVALFFHLLVGVFVLGIAFLFVPLGGALGGLTVGGVSIPDLQLRLRSFVFDLPGRTMTFVVGVGSALPSFADGLAGLAETTGDVLAGLGRGLAASLRLFATGLGGLFVSLPKALGGLFSLGGGLSRVGSGLGRSRATEDESPSPATAAAPDEPEPDTGPPSIEEAWTTLRERVPLRNPRSATPGEVARAAVDFGLPSGPVGRLTRAFEEVRYGGASASGSRLTAARRAFSRLFGSDSE